MKFKNRPGISWDTRKAIYHVNTLFGNLNNFGENVFHYVPKEEKKTEKELYFAKDVLIYPYWYIAYLCTYEPADWLLDCNLVGIVSTSFPIPSSARPTCIYTWLWMNEW